MPSRGFGHARAPTTDAKSADLFSRAQKLLPGGVNSPVRAFRAVGGSPVFFEKASGATLTAVDGKEYLDYVGSWGPMILGHAHPSVVSAVRATMEKSPSFGAPSPLEVEIAELVTKLVPSIEMMRMTSSGTEAVMGALRAARGFTGRDLVVKFEGCYHGGADYLLVQAGSGLATFGVPTSAGVPAAIGATTIVLPYNDLPAAQQLFAARGKDIAALILEPVVGNMGLVPPVPGLLEGLRALTAEHGALLVFDEVMTGFRVARGAGFGEWAAPATWVSDFVPTSAVTGSFGLAITGQLAPDHVPSGLEDLAPSGAHPDGVVAVYDSALSRRWARRIRGGGSVRGLDVERDGAHTLALLSCECACDIDGTTEDLGPSGGYLLLDYEE